MKLIIRTIPFLLILLFGATLPTHAQDSNVSVAFGLGSAGDTSNGQCISNFQEMNGNCETAGTAPFTGFTAPKMTGLFGKFGADFMLNKHLGVGGEYAFRASQGAYGDVKYRPNFYDFNVLYHPLSGGENQRIVPEIQGGVGGVNVKFYQPSQCDQLTCSGSVFVESANHFQVHGAVGVKLYVKGGLFIRPQVDIHWVNNFNQFGSGWVPEGTIAIGYTLGSH